MGNNVGSMSIQDVYSAIGLINSSLGNTIDINKGYVRRLDIGINLIMDNQPTAYVGKLYSLSARKPTYFNGQTISNGNQSRGIIVYDKTAEVEKGNKKNRTQTEVPEKLLRLEASIKGRKVFEKKFGTELPTVKSLLEQLDKLPDVLYEEYNKLDKAYSVSTDLIHDKGEFLNYTIVATGMEKCKYVIDYSYNLELISKQNRDRYYKTVKNAFHQSTSTANEDLMKELDDKVLAWYNSTKTSSST
jgi:hypothetical protein